MYWISKMCFLCLSNNKSLITYKCDSENKTNKYLKMLLYCYPELNERMLDVPIYMCNNCDKQLILYYKFKSIGEINYNYYLTYVDTLKETNKGKMKKYMDCNVQMDCSSEMNQKDAFIDFIIKEEEIDIDNDSVSNFSINDIIESDVQIKEEYPALEEYQPHNVNNYIFGENEFIENILIHNESKQETETNEMFESETKIELNLQNGEEINTNILSKSNLNVNDNVTKENLISQNEIETNTNVFTNSELDVNNICDQQKGNNSIQSLETNAKEVPDKPMKYFLILPTKNPSLLHNNILSNQQNLNSNRRKTYFCTICSKHFTQKSNLMRHLQVHSGEKPFSCSICLKTFSQNPHLKAHMRIHSGEKPFSCFICSKSFRQKSNLNVHMRVHTPFTHKDLLWERVLINYDAA